jgi:LysR family transcriptional regulator for metE and metH
MMIDTRLLASFKAVAEHRSFTGGALALGVTQPLVSQHVHTLESQLGMRLFVRSNKVIGLTPAGETLLQCAQAVTKLDQMRNCTPEYSEEGCSRLAIAAEAAACSFLLAPLTEQLRKRFPNADVVVLSIPVNAALQKLITRELDFVIAPCASATSQMKQLPLGRDELVLLIPSEHPLAARDVLRAEDLRNQPVIMPPKSNEDYSAWREFLAEAGVSPHVAIETDSLELSRAMANSSVGLAMMPAWAVDGYPNDRTVVKRLRQSASRQWSVIYNSAESHSAVHLNFLQACADMLPGMLAGKQLETREPETTLETLIPPRALRSLDRSLQHS